MLSEANAEQPADGSAAAAADGQLTAVVAELEQHADSLGWDRPPTLFALVPTAELVAAEPALAAALGLADGPVDAGGLTPVEQEPLGDGPLDEALAGIQWPPEVAGCALINEVLVLPPSAGEAPAGTDPIRWASEHPARREVRLVVGVVRDGGRASLLRIRPTALASDEPVVPGADLAPNLAAALLSTLD
ncbi:PPA1309 family protein [Fodinicola feengrottensis]|uniref:PPA1309 family protein n=1 Tax=Fodinicola feengrottensis TaxID=435914 RepID=A0ABN2II80_9ACTN|nr:PPA1309 family protein [Fodinicola feengrottensis]